MAGPEDTGSLGKRSPAAPAPALTKALEAIGTAAYVVDEEGRVIAVNAHAEQLLLRPAETLLGRDAHDVLHRDAHGHPLPRSRCSMRQPFHAGRTAQAEGDWFERGDGSLLPVSWLITPYDVNGHEAGTLVLVHAQHPPGTGRRSGTYTAAKPLPELERLALLAETTTRLTSTLDVEEALRRLVDLVVPRLADWAVVDLITERDEVWRTAVVHAEGDTLVHHEDLQGPMPPVPEDSPMPLSRALRGVASALAGPQTYLREPDSGIALEQRRLFDGTGIRSAAIAPIRSTRAVLGALTLGRAKDPTDFT
ncbi:PAS domain-containing protein, partial [Streptomyces sp. NPDC019531]|uniref:PAS domain-containing protein n=1 Tax=Streptomyces sp. NPDC019531 TaxID=3365062 RepID=UPI003850C96F